MTWSLLRTRRWLAFTALVVFVIIAFGLLSRWQWSRAEDKRVQRIDRQVALDATPVSLGAVALTDGSVGEADEWRHVTATGQYLDESQALVRKRPLDGMNGFWVMTPLQTDTGVVWIDRGWMPVSGDALSTPPIPPAPAGTVEVSGYLRAWEDADADDNVGLPAGMIAAPAPALLPPMAGAYPGFVQLAASQPAQDGLTALPVPEIDDGRNLSYAVQWLLFAAVAIGGWYVFLRREARDDALRAAASSGGQ